MMLFKLQLTEIRARLPSTYKKIYKQKKNLTLRLIYVIQNSFFLRYFQNMCLELERKLNKTNVHDNNQHCTLTIFFSFEIQLSS